MYEFPAGPLYPAMRIPINKNMTNAMYQKKKLNKENPWFYPVPVQFSDGYSWVACDHKGKTPGIRIPLGNNQFKFVPYYTHTYVSDIPEESGA